jgi:hypothetical protein
VLVTGHGTRDGHKPDYKPRRDPEHKFEAQADAHAYAAHKWRLYDRRRPAARVICRCAFVLLYRMQGAAAAASLVVIGLLESALDPTGSTTIANVFPAQA